MKIKLLILAGFASCLWSVRELPLPQIDQALYHRTPAPENLEGHWRTVKPLLFYACPIYMRHPNNRHADDAYRMSVETYFSNICSRILNYQNTPLPDYRYTIMNLTNNSCCYPYADSLNSILGNLFLLIKYGQSPTLQKRLYLVKHDFVELITSENILYDQSEIKIKDALYTYFAMCFGGTFALIGGHLNKITIHDDEFLVIKCSLGDYFYYVRVRLALEHNRVQFDSQVQRITEPEPELY